MIASGIVEKLPKMVGNSTRGLRQLCLKICLNAFTDEFLKIFLIMSKNQPIMLKIMLVYFNYCIIYTIRLPGKFES